MKIRQYQSEDQAAVVQLWKDCDLVKPWNDPLKDIYRKLDDSPESFFIGEEDGKLVAAVMAGYEGHRGWINYLAVSPDGRGLGLGREMMDYVETYLLERGCPKINLQVRDTNTDVLAFYKALGYQVDACVSLGKRLIPDIAPTE